jgi:type I restriction enzyme S subunit
MMLEGWKKVKWGDVATLEYGKSLKNYQDSSGNIPVYGTNGLIGFTHEPLCQIPSVIVGRKGAYRGIHFSKTPFYVIDTAFYLRPKRDDLDLKYAYYQLLTLDINGMDSGSAIPSTSRPDFYNLDLNLPDIYTQQKIASILSSLDDKIELNLQMNKTLEAIAQTIFKEWFNDFRFAGFDGELVDGLPKGWRKSTIGNISKKVQYGYTQSSSIEEIGPKFLRITDIQNGNVDWSQVPYCSIDGKEFDKYRIQDHDIFIARTGASTGENIYIIEPPSSVFASYLIRVQFDKPEYAYYIGKFLRRQEYVNYISSSLGGSAQPNTNAKILTNIEVVFPENKILMNYFDLTFPFHLRIVKNQKENQTLTQLRDILLPKLMTGKIRV